MKVDGNGKAAVLNEDQLDRLLEGAPAANHRALWAIQRWTAARVSEALSLQWKAVDGGVITFKRQTTKTKRTKQINTGKRLAQELEAYRQEWIQLHGHDPKPGDYLFPSRSSTKEPMTRQSADLALRNTLKAMAIPGASTHSFRRSLATNALHRGCSLKAIQKVTGHKTLDGLGHYLDVSDGEVMSVIEG